MSDDAPGNSAAEKLKAAPEGPERGAVVVQGATADPMQPGWADAPQSVDGASVAATAASSEAGGAPSQGGGFLADPAASRKDAAAVDGAVAVGADAAASKGSGGPVADTHPVADAVTAIDAAEVSSEMAADESGSSDFDDSSDSSRAASGASMYDAESQVGSGSLMSSAAPEAALPEQHGPLTEQPPPADTYTVSAVQPAAGKSADSFRPQEVLSCSCCPPGAVRLMLSQHGHDISPLATTTAAMGLQSCRMC